MVIWLTITGMLCNYDFVLDVREATLEGFIDGLDDKLIQAIQDSRVEDQRTCGLLLNKGIGGRLEKAPNRVDSVTGASHHGEFADCFKDSQVVLFGRAGIIVKASKVVVFVVILFVVLRVDEEILSKLLLENFLRET